MIDTVLYDSDLARRSTRAIGAFSRRMDPGAGRKWVGRFSSWLAPLAIVVGSCGQLRIVVATTARSLIRGRGAGLSFDWPDHRFR